MKQEHDRSHLLFSFVVDELIKAARQQMKAFLVGNWKMERINLREFVTKNILHKIMSKLIFQGRKEQVKIANTWIHIETTK